MYRFYLKYKPGNSLPFLHFQIKVKQQLHRACRNQDRTDGSAEKQNGKFRKIKSVDLTIIRSAGT